MELRRELPELLTIWREKWGHFWRYETAAFIGGPLDGMSYPVPREAEEWFHPGRDGDVRYVRWRPVFGSLVASYWRAEDQHVPRGEVLP